MKKTLITILALLVTFVTTNFVCALDNGVVDISLSGTKEIAPDAFQLTFAVETQNTDVQKAVTENKENSEKLYNTLKSMLNTTRGDYIKTSNYSVRPNYEYSSKGKRTLKDYTVYNSVTVYVKDITTVSKFVNAAATKGVTQVDNLSFKTTSYENECNALLGELTNKAKNRANASLKPLGLQVLALKTLNTSCSESTNYPTVNYAMRAKALGATANSDSVEESAPVEAGKTILRANINSSFYVGTKK
ncbi:SIMPL domain-containing protein [bacterium]|nr:SIMPL domain-containing protein [bacterium]